MEASSRDLQKWCLPPFAPAQLQHLPAYMICEGSTGLQAEHRSAQEKNADPTAAAHSTTKTAYTPSQSFGVNVPTFLVILGKQLSSRRSIGKTMKVMTPYQLVYG
jgi:hypothetical protein